LRSLHFSLPLPVIFCFDFTQVFHPRKKIWEYIGLLKLELAPGNLTRRHLPFIFKSLAKYWGESNFFHASYSFYIYMPLIWLLKINAVFSTGETAWRNSLMADP
jgi:hypothetical protein